MFFNLNECQSAPQNINPVFNRSASNSEYLNNLDDASSVSDGDEFKDMEANGEKLFGTELFDEFPVNERKVKLEEQVNFFSS